MLPKVGDRLNGGTVETVRKTFDGKNLHVEVTICSDVDSRTMGFYNGKGDYVYIGQQANKQRMKNRK